MYPEAQFTSIKEKKVTIKDLEPSLTYPPVVWRGYQCVSSRTERCSQHSRYLTLSCWCLQADNVDTPNSHNKQQQVKYLHRLPPMVCLLACAMDSGTDMSRPELENSFGDKAVALMSLVVTRVRSECWMCILYYMVSVCSAGLRMGRSILECLWVCLYEQSVVKTDIYFIYSVQCI